MIQVVEFGLDLLAPESFESEETPYRALLELAHQAICTFNFFVMARLSGFVAQAMARHSVGHPKGHSFWLFPQNPRRPDPPPAATI
jgi:hypothetical protein